MLRRNSGWYFYQSKSPHWTCTVDTYCTVYWVVTNTKPTVILWGSTAYVSISIRLQPVDNDNVQTLMFSRYNLYHVYHFSFVLACYQSFFLGGGVSLLLLAGNNYFFVSTKALKGFLSTKPKHKKRCHNFYLHCHESDF